MAKKQSAVDMSAAAEPAQIVPHFDFMLVVKNPFGEYFYGQLISEDAAIEAVIESGNLRNCNRIPR